MLLLGRGVSPHQGKMLHLPARSIGAREERVSATVIQTVGTKGNDESLLALVQ